MAEIEIPEFNVEKDGYNGNIATFYSTCVSKVEMFAVSSSTDGSSWEQIEWPDWLISGITDTSVTLVVNPLGDNGLPERRCTLSALTYSCDEGNKNCELISAGTCGYVVEVIQKKSTAEYTLPTNDDMPKNINPKCECTISGTSGGEEEEDGYHVPSTGGIASFESTIRKKN